MNKDDWKLIIVSILSVAFGTFIGFSFALNLWGMYYPIA